MGAKSRNKGNAFERKIASLFGKVYNRELRRVPLSGGIVLRCDIYDPVDDSFPLFIECKSGYNFTIKAVIEGTSPLFEFMIDTRKKAEESHITKKYGRSPVPILVFRGGDFTCDMVAFYMGSLSDTMKDRFFLVKDGVRFVTLDSFLSMKPLNSLVLPPGN